MKKFIIESRSKYNHHVNKADNISILLRGAENVISVKDDADKSYKFTFEVYTGKLTILESFENNLVVTYE
jgi:hypothetical protein